MKKLKLIYVIVMMMLIPQSINGHSLTDMHNSQQMISVNIKKIKASRPRCPSRQRVEVTFDYETLCVKFEIPEGAAVLQIFNSRNEEVVICDFDTSTPYTYNVEDSTDWARLEITTETGNVYEGFFDVPISLD